MTGFKGTRIPNLEAIKEINRRDRISRSCIICEKLILKKDRGFANEPGTHPGILGLIHPVCYEKAVEAQPDLPWTDPISGQVDYREMASDIGFSDPEEDMDFEGGVY